MVVCLGQGADLHMPHLMPLSLTMNYSALSLDTVEMRSDINDRCCLRCTQVSRLEAEKLELTGSLCSMQQKLTAFEVIAQELEEERVNNCRTLHLFEVMYIHTAAGIISLFFVAT